MSRIEDWKASDFFVEVDMVSFAAALKALISVAFEADRKNARGGFAARVVNGTWASQLLTSHFYRLPLQNVEYLSDGDLRS